jgi:hypothetical protein
MSLMYEQMYMLPRSCLLVLITLVSTARVGDVCISWSNLVVY